MTVPGLYQPIAAVAVLADGKTLKMNATAAGLEIAVPDKAPDAIASVIKVTVKGQVTGITGGAKKKMKTGALD